MSAAELVKASTVLKVLHAQISGNEQQTATQSHMDFDIYVEQLAGGLFALVTLAKRYDLSQSDKPTPAQAHLLADENLVHVSVELVEYICLLTTVAFRNPGELIEALITLQNIQITYYNQLQQQLQQQLQIQQQQSSQNQPSITMQTIVPEAITPTIQMGHLPLSQNICQNVDEIAAFLRLVVSGCNNNCSNSLLNSGSCALLFADFLDHLRLLCVRLLTDISILSIRFASVPVESIHGVQGYVENIILNDHLFSRALLWQSMGLKDRHSESTALHLVPYIWQILASFFHNEPSCSLVAHSALDSLEMLALTFNDHHRYRSVNLANLTSKWLIERHLSPVITSMQLNMRSAKIKQTSLKRTSISLLRAIIQHLKRFIRREYSKNETEHEDMINLLVSYMSTFLNWTKQFMITVLKMYPVDLKDNLPITPVPIMLDDILEPSDANRQTDLLSQRVYQIKQLFVESIEFLLCLREAKRYTMSHSEQLFQFCMDFAELEPVCSSDNTTANFKEILSPLQLFQFRNTDRDFESSIGSWRMLDIAWSDLSRFPSTATTYGIKEITSESANKALPALPQTPGDPWKRFIKLMKPSEKSDHSMIYQTGKDLLDEYFTEQDNEFAVPPTLESLEDMKAASEALLGLLVDSFNFNGLTSESNSIIDSTICQNVFFQRSRFFDFASFSNEQEYDDLSFIQDVRNSAGINRAKLSMKHGTNPYQRKVASSAFTGSSMGKSTNYLSPSIEIPVLSQSELVIFKYTEDETSVDSTKPASKPHSPPPKSPTHVYRPRLPKAAAMKASTRNSSLMDYNAELQHRLAIGQDWNAVSSSIKNVLNVFEKNLHSDSHNRSHRQSIVKAITADFDSSDVVDYPMETNNNLSLPVLENNDFIFIISSEIINNIETLNLSARSNSNLAITAMREPAPVKESVDRLPRLFSVETGLMFMEKQSRTISATIKEGENRDRFTDITAVFSSEPQKSSISISFFELGCDGINLDLPLSEEAKMTLDAIAPHIPVKDAEWTGQYSNFAKRHSEIALQSIPYINDPSTFFVIHYNHDGFAGHCDIADGFLYNNDLVAIVYVTPELHHDRRCLVESLSKLTHILFIIAYKLESNLFKTEIIVRNIPEAAQLFTVTMREKCGPLHTGSICLQKTFGSLVRHTAMNIHRSLIDQLFLLSPAIKAESHFERLKSLVSTLNTPYQWSRRRKMLKLLQRLAITSLQLPEPSRSLRSSSMALNSAASQSVQSLVRLQRPKQSVADFLKTVHLTCN